MFFHKPLVLIKKYEEVKKKGHLCTVGGNRNWYNHYGKFLKKTLQMKLYDLIISLLGINLKESKTLKKIPEPSYSSQHYLQ